MSVDKTLLHSSHIQTRKHNNPGKTVILQVRFHKEADKINMEPAMTVAAKTKVSSLIRLIKNHRKILKLLQF